MALHDPDAGGWARSPGPATALGTCLLMTYTLTMTALHRGARLAISPPRPHLGWSIGHLDRSHCRNLPVDHRVRHLLASDDQRLHQAPSPARRHRGPELLWRLDGDRLDRRDGLVDDRPRHSWNLADPLGARLFAHLFGLGRPVIQQDRKRQRSFVGGDQLECQHIANGWYGPNPDRRR